MFVVLLELLEPQVTGAVAAEPKISLANIKLVLMLGTALRLGKKRLTIQFQLNLAYGWGMFDGLFDAILLLAARPAEGPGDGRLGRPRADDSGGHGRDQFGGHQLSPPMVGPAVSGGSTWAVGVAVGLPASSKETV